MNFLEIFLYIAIILIILMYLVLKINKILCRIRNLDPTIWEREIKRYERKDKVNPPSEDTILFIGSSSIRRWKTLDENMAPLRVTSRGIGGSRIADIIYYINRIVLPYNPKGIVFYAGENDVIGLLGSPKRKGEEVKEDIEKFCDKIYEELGDIPIFYVSIKPPKKPKSSWNEAKKANSLIKEFCQTKNTLFFIDIVSVLMDKAEIKERLFKWDGIHINQKGYNLWASVIKSILVTTFQIDS